MEQWIRNTIPDTIQFGPLCLMCRIFVDNSWSEHESKIIKLIRCRCCPKFENNRLCFFVEKWGNNWGWAVPSSVQAGASLVSCRRTDNFFWRHIFEWLNCQAWFTLITLTRLFFNFSWQVWNFPDFSWPVLMCLNLFSLVASLKKLSQVCAPSAYLWDIKRVL